MAGKKHNSKKAKTAVHHRKAAHRAVKTAKKPAKRAVARHSKKSAKPQPRAGGAKSKQKLWLAKPHEKDPGLEEDWKSDLDDEMDFEETGFESES